MRHIILVLMLLFTTIVWAGEKVNINTASHQQFVDLPGIGESGASLILEYRTTRRFKSPSDIQSVKRQSGRRVVGDKTFEKIKDLITAE